MDIISVGPTLFKVDGKIFKVKKITYKKDNSTPSKQILEEVNQGEYEAMLSDMADKLLKTGGVDTKAILVDCLTEFPMEKLNTLQRALNSELAREKPRVRTRSGHCTEIHIGPKYGFVLRDN